MIVLNSVFIPSSNSRKTAEERNIYSQKSNYQQVKNLKFKVVLDEDEDGGLVVTVPALPGCISQGDTQEEALENIKEAIELHLSSLAEDGIPISGKKKVKTVAVAL